jgi:hypothetical protein
MKKLLFAVCALAAISLLAPSAGFADAWQNRIGIYTTDTATAANIAATPLFTPTNLYFVVSNPQFADGSGPMPSIDAFEFKVSVQPPSGFFVLSVTKPAGIVDVGAGADLVNGTFEYQGGWPAGLPVVNGVVSVMSWSIMFQAAGTYNFYLNPVTIPTHAGFMAVNYTTPPPAETPFLADCMPSSGAFADPVFTVGGTNTPSESASFGSVKSLFR